MVGWQAVIRLLGAATYAEVDKAIPGSRLPTLLAQLELRRDGIHAGRWIENRESGWDRFPSPP
jgi:hypothetical protein